jgi:hypothetical protein
MMARRWKEQEIEKMLDYRDQGLTEAKIAEKLSIIFMRRFTYESVNRKIRDLKRMGYIEQNPHTGRFKNATGEKRKGEKSAKITKFQRQKRVRKPVP